VRISLERAYADGTVAVDMDPLSLLCRLATTLAVIEHHPAVIAAADHLIELGPEGGEAGGHLVAQGTPREVAKKATATGLVLKELFAKGVRAKASKVVTTIAAP
jgi:excinuclease ABC subunit A